MAYNPYKDIKAIYDAKVGWENATSEEEKNRLHEAANKARALLEYYGYGDLASRASAYGANDKDVKALLSEWAPVTDTGTGSYKTGIDNPAYNASINSAMIKNDDRTNIIKSDHTNTNSKYNDLFAYANQDITKTDEYKSAFDNIMPSYNLKAMQGRDNAAASGAASNGGNVDSFAAANASRQQAALTAKGQALAHQMGLEAYQARLQGAQNVLTNLGAYNEGVYSALNEGVSNDVGIANTVFSNEQTAKQNAFNNEQTAKINDTSIKAEIASVIGLSPDEWVVGSTNPYVNDDGTIKDEYKDVDFSTVMAKAKAANNDAAYKAAAVARYYKIMGDYKQWGQYDDGNYIVPEARPTEAASEFDDNLALNYKMLEMGKTPTAATTPTTKTTTKKTSDGKTGTLTLTQATSAIKNGELSDAVLAVYNAELGTSYTKDNPPPIYKAPESETKKIDDLAKEWADKLNSDIESRYGKKHKALVSNKDGTYKLGNVDADYVILAIYKSNELTAEQKETLLYDKFHIDESQVQAVVNDPHYK